MLSASQEAGKIAARRGGRKVRARFGDLSAGWFAARFRDPVIRFPMIHPTLRRFLIALIALFTAVPAAAQQTQAFHSGDAGYTVQLPAGWRQMPDAEIVPMRDAGAAAGQPFTLEAGYRVTDSPTGWPFVTLSSLDLGQTFTTEQFGAAVMGAHTRGQSQPGVDGVRVDAPTWDAENRTVWSRTRMASDGRFTLTASTLHPDGGAMVVLVYYGAPGEDEVRVRADLLHIVRSLTAE
jgi:hypothetical protein